MNHDTFKAVREQFEAIRAADNLPADMGLGDYYLCRYVSGHRVGFYVNLSPADAQQHGSIAKAARTKLTKLEAVVAQVNQFRADLGMEPFLVIDRYIDTEHYRTRFTIRPEARRIVTDLDAGRVDLMLAVSRDDLVSSVEQLDDLNDAVVFTRRLALDAYDELNRY